MKFVATILGAIVLSTGISNGAGAKPGEKVKPAEPVKKGEPAARVPFAEVRRLGELAGTWKLEGQIQKSPMGPGGKSSAISKCAWFDGEFFLVCRAEGTSPMGKTSGMSVLGWDPERKVYTFFTIDSMGMTSTARGTVDGKTWTWSSEEKMGGKKMKSRFVLVQDTPDRNKTSWSISPDGQTWSELFSGEETREKVAPKVEPKKAPKKKKAA
jgi:hypothetical protein